MPSRRLSAAGRERMTAAVRAGHTTEAIRLYRQGTHVSLAEANAAVDAMAAGQRDGVAEIDVTADEAVRAAVYAGRKIEAIKLYRQSRRVDLRQAKTAVEQLEAELRRTTPQQFTGPSKSDSGSWVWLIIVLIVLAGIAVVTSEGVAWWTFGRGW